MPESSTYVLRTCLLTLRRRLAGGSSNDDSTGINHVCQTLQWGEVYILSSKCTNRQLWQAAQRLQLNNTSSHHITLSSNTTEQTMLAYRFRLVLLWRLTDLCSHGFLFLRLFLFLLGDDSGGLGAGGLGCRLFCAHICLEAECLLLCEVLSQS